MPYTPTTKILRSDLQVYASERLTDNDDGGGMPTKIKLTGADNELFDPISAIAWLNGGFYARLVYMGVRRDDDEPLLGAYTAITVPPKNGNVSYLMFPATKFGELRHEVMKRIESYVIGTIESNLTLLSIQPQNGKILQAYQSNGSSLPIVGDTFCLRQDKDGYPQHEQYVKVVSVESEYRQFITRQGKEFSRVVVKMEISAKLKADFVGVEYPEERYANPPCKILETQVADASQYYGVMPLSKAINKGDIDIKLPSIMAQIIPTNQINTSLPDTDIGLRTLSFDSGKQSNDGFITCAKNITNPNNINKIYLPTSIAVGSLTISNSSIELAESKSGKLLVNGEQGGNIDYKNGIIEFDENLSSTYFNHIKYRPTFYHQQISDTTRIFVSENNQRESYIITLEPLPADNSLTVSYLSQGRWYDLYVDGTGVLRGSSQAHGGGNINYKTGTVSLTCGALPDVGSSIIFSWATRRRYHNVSEQTPKTYMQIDIEPEAIKNSIAISWKKSGKNKNAHVNNNSKLIGDWAGYYKDGKIYVDITDNHFDNPATVKISYSKGERSEIESTKSNTHIANDGTTTLNLAQAINPNTLSFSCYMQTDDPLTNDPVMQAWLWWDSRRIDINDDGNGKLLDSEDNEVGTINYSSGECTLNVNRKGKLGFNIFSPYLYGGKEYTHKTGRDVKEVDTMLESIDGIYCYSSSNQSNANKTIEVNKTPLVLTLDCKDEKIAKNSVCFNLQDTFYYDRNGEIYCDYNLFSGEITPIGTINYSNGEVMINEWEFVNHKPIMVTALATYSPYNPISTACFRIKHVPVATGSLQIRAETMDGEIISGVASNNGWIQNDHMTAEIDCQYGVVSVEFKKKVKAESIIYNAVAQTELPINSNIVKINTVKLPKNGKVAIFRVGDSILISNSKTEDIGSAFSSGQTVNLSRDDVDRICLRDSDGKPVNAELWDYDLDAGTITFATPLDLSQYKKPLLATHTREERNRVLEVNIDGTLKLKDPTLRAYEVEDTYVSSLLIGDTLQVRHSIPFTQRNWDGVWRDKPNGEQLLNKLNLTNYPMVLTDDGAITQDWLIKFVSSSQFEVYGDSLGYVGRFDLLTDLAPINPATNKPYFIVPKEAFGDTDAPWATHNVIRFKTWGTLMPVWILCAAQPTNQPQVGTDGFKYCFYGDTTAI